MRVFLILNFLLLTAPTALYAAEQSLLPAICEQVLTPQANASVPGIIVSHVVERVKELPMKIVGGVNDMVGGVANALADKLEGEKSEGTLIAANAAGVLGTSTSMVG